MILLRIIMNAMIILRNGRIILRIGKIIFRIGWRILLYLRSCWKSAYIRQFGQMFQIQGAGYWKIWSIFQEGYKNFQPRRNKIEYLLLLQEIGLTWKYLDCGNLGSKGRESSDSLLFWRDNIQSKCGKKYSWTARLISFSAGVNLGSAFQRLE